MTRRLTIRTLTVSALIVVIVAGVLGGLTLAIDRQHDAGERARRSQAVIAAANLTQQRLLAVQTTVRGFLIRGNHDAAERLPVGARGVARRRRWSCRALVERRSRAAPAAPSRSTSRRSPTSTTTPTRSSRARARTGVGAGRAFATANDGSARAEELQRR